MFVEPTPAPKLNCAGVDSVDDVVSSLPKLNCIGVDCVEDLLLVFFWIDPVSSFTNVSFLTISRCLVLCSFQCAF